MDLMHIASLMWFNCAGIWRGEGLRGNKFKVPIWFVVLIVIVKTSCILDFMMAPCVHHHLKHHLKLLVFYIGPFPKCTIVECNEGTSPFTHQGHTLAYMM